MEEQSIKKLNIEDWQKLAKAGANVHIKIEPTGMSMRPLIRGGKDLVIVEPMRRELMCGDIVLFLRADGAHVLHRTWKIDGDRVTTYGDGCWYPDEPICKGKILGLATGLYRRKTSKTEPKGRPINLDTKFRRKTGLLWLNAAPVRRTYYRVRNIAHSIKRRFF